MTAKSLEIRFYINMIFVNQIYQKHFKLWNEKLEISDQLQETMLRDHRKLKPKYFKGNIYISKIS